MHELLESRLVLGAGPLVVSELMAANDATLADRDGDFSDWIEIHNPTTAAVGPDQEAAQTFECREHLSNYHADQPQAGSQLQAGDDMWDCAGHDAMDDRLSLAPTKCTNHLCILPSAGSEPGGSGNQDRKDSEGYSNCHFGGKPNAKPQHQQGANTMRGIA